MDDQTATVVVWGLIGVTIVLLGTVLWRLPRRARALADAVRAVQTAVRASPYPKRSLLILGTLLVILGVPFVALMVWLLPRWAALVTAALDWVARR
jgi:hypothetical protein